MGTPLFSNISESAVFVLHNGWLSVANSKSKQSNFKHRFIKMILGRENSHESQQGEVNSCTKVHSLSKMCFNIKLPIGDEMTIPLMRPNDYWNLSFGPFWRRQMSVSHDKFQDLMCSHNKKPNEKCATNILIKRHFPTTIQPMVQWFCPLDYCSKPVR